MADGMGYEGSASEISISRFLQKIKLNPPLAKYFIVIPDFNLYT